MRRVKRNNLGTSRKFWKYVCACDPPHNAIRSAHGPHGPYGLSATVQNANVRLALVVDDVGSGRQRASAEQLEWLRHGSPFFGRNHFLDIVRNRVSRNPLSLTVF